GGAGGGRPRRAGAHRGPERPLPRPGAEDAVAMAAPRAGRDAMVAAGAVPVSHVPEASLGRADIEEVAGAELVEDTALAVHAVEAEAGEPLSIRFLDGS